MKIYSIVYTREARRDLHDLYFFIVSEYKTLLTAERYVDGLENTILQLKTTAESFKVQTYIEFQKYGDNVRRVNYKRMAIIYTVDNQTVYIHRIIPAAMITE